MGKSKILIIDDDIVTITVLREFLSESGYEVFHAKNWETGLKLLSEIQPDMVLLDVIMPDIDGIEILKIIKEDKRFSHIPVLMLTSVDRSDIKVKGFEIGADDYITKPVNQAELRARIKAVLKRSKPKKSESNFLKGNLKAFSLPDLLQSAELGKKTASIKFIDMDAELLVQDGFIVSCRFRNFNGEKALNRIFFLNRGQFVVEFPENIRKTEYKEKQIILNVLMENISFVDEAKEMERKLSATSDKIKFTEKIKILTGIEGIPVGTYVEIDELIVLMNGDIKENIEALDQINRDFPFEYEKQ